MFFGTPDQAQFQPIILSRAEAQQRREAKDSRTDLHGDVLWDA